MKKIYYICSFTLLFSLAKSQTKTTSSVNFYLHEFVNKHANTIIKTYFNKHLICKKILIQQDDSKIQYQITSLYSDTCLIANSTKTFKSCRFRSKYFSSIGKVNLTVYSVLRCDKYEYCMIEMTDKKNEKTVLILFRMDLEKQLITNKIKTIVS